MRLITNLKNIEYLTGFTGSHAFLLLGNKKNYFFTDSRYLGGALKLQAKTHGIKFEVIEIKENLEKILKKIMGRKEKIEFEPNDLTVNNLKSWKKKLKNIKFTEIKEKDSIETIRSQKEESEIKNIKKSQGLNEKALERIQFLLKPGVTELEIAWQIRKIAHELGIDELSFDPIVAFGKNSAIPHHCSSGARLKPKDIILIDMGLKFSGYCSDMTRTFLPKNPSKKHIEIYKIVLKAQTEVIKKIKAGVPVKKLDELARKIMGKYEKYFGHSLGHGLGLEIHEMPRLSRLSQEKLKENMVITIEPGIYLPEEFGIRIEDMGRVTKNGFELFTTYKK